MSEDDWFAPRKPSEWTMWGGKTRYEVEHPEGWVPTMPKDPSEIRVDSGAVFDGKGRWLGSLDGRTREWIERFDMGDFRWSGQKPLEPMEFEWKLGQKGSPTPSAVLKSAQFYRTLANQAKSAGSKAGLDKISDEKFAEYERIKLP